MKQFLISIIFISAIQCLYSQVPCETECCPNGPQHTFGDMSGPLPDFGQSGGGSWIAANGSPYYNSEDGCDSPSSLALPPVGFSGTSEASFSETGIAGPIIQFQEGQTYCFQICTKNLSDFEGSVDLYADGTFIQSTSTITFSDGWLSDEFYWTATSDYFSFSIINNSSSPVDGATVMLVDDICYSLSSLSVSCEASFTFEETECGEYCFEDQSCGEYSQPVWKITGTGLPSGGIFFEEENPCYRFLQFGTFTIELTIFCADGTVSTTSQTIDPEIPAPPLYDCPSSDTVITTDPTCNYEYTLPSLSLTFGTAQCTIENTTTNSGQVPINEGESVLLDPGVHQIVCTIASECYPSQICSYTIEVICVDKNICIEDFESNEPTPFVSSVGNWTSAYCDIAYQIDGSTNGSTVLVGSDESGASFFGNLVDFKGDWISDYKSCELCFDIRYDNGDPSNPSTGPSSIFVYENGPPNNIIPTNTNYTRFTVNNPIGNTWTRVCAPVELSDGVNLPSNAQGAWTSATPSQFDQVIQNVDGISFYVDFGGGSNQSEKLYVDNICFEECPCYSDDIDCDSFMAMANPIENLCFDPSIITGNPCIFIDDPVCGCDGNTYFNSCIATEQGITTYVNGDCNGQNTPVIEDKCCYSIDLKNNWGPDIVEIEVDIIDPDWIFNKVILDPAFDLGSCGSFNQNLCIESTTGSIPIGTTTGVFETCFASLSNNPTTNPVIEIKWKQVVNELDTAIVCRDTLTFECLPPPPDTCLIVTNQEVDCNPEDPAVYDYCFDVTNRSGVDVGQITLECLDQGFFFNPPLNLNSQIVIPSPNPLADGQSTQVCIALATTVPIIESQDVCMKMGLISADGKECCHEPVKVCVTIDPCCDPCELKDVIVTNLLSSEGECCYGIGLENLCEIPYFTKFEAEVLTPGVCLDNVFIDPVQSSNWSTTVSANSICLLPQNGGVLDQVFYSDLFEFCLDKIDDPSQNNPEIVFRWYASDPINGENFVACTDTLVTECVVEPICCTDFEAFCELVDLGFTVNDIGECSVTVEAPQFDSCHWYATEIPDWGDGQSPAPNIIPAQGAGPWTYTYPQSGTYTICMTVLEGEGQENLCWEKEMCTEITIECEPVNTLCGQTVITCFSGNLPDNSIANGYVLGIVNNKEWGPNQTGLDWAAASGPNIFHHPTWIASRLGEVFGLAIDGSDQIYATSAGIFGNTLFGSAGPGGIYKVDPTSGTVTDFINTGTGVNELPNDGAGLGNICFDPDHNQLFVTNFYDGNIYRIDVATGSILGSFDPFGATSVNGTPQFADLGQRPWGIAYNQTDQKLYFSNWVDYSGIPVPNPTATTIHSVSLDAAGDFQTSTESLEITLAQYWNSSPISDIEFDVDGKMLIAQRSMQADRMSAFGFAGGNWAHRSFVLEYQRSGPSWSLTPGHSGGLIPKFGIGPSSYRNSAGGIDYGYESHPNDAQPQFCGASVWSSGDNLSADRNVQRWLYGLQGMTNTGGTNVGAVIIDYDGIYTSGEKAFLGDVQIFDCECYTSDVDCDSLMVMSNEIENLCIDPDLVDPDLICLTVFDPVCGCDGETYGNACEALREGITTTVPGACNGNNTPDVENDCCYSIDLKNNWGPDIVEIEVDIIDPDWIFNTVVLDPAFDLGSCGSLNQKLCIESTTGSIPQGTIAGVFETCFASLSGNPTTNPIIEIKWKQVVNELDTVIACRDTLTLNCMPPPPIDTCLVVTNQEINCDQGDPTIYNYCFDVTNQSGVDISQITMECLDPGFFFNPPFNLNSHIAIPTPNPLLDGQTTQVCVDIYTSLTIITPQDVCMKLGLISADGKECCHNPIVTCAQIEPCCDPCELKDVLSTSISMNEEECCYSIGLENLCEIPYFTKFEAEVLTPGVCFGSHVLDPTQLSNWNQISTSRNICLSPVGSGYIDQVSYPGLLDFCLDKIDDISQRNPEVVFRWYAIDPLTGNTEVMCTDTLITECMEPDNNICLEVYDQDLECVQDSSKYRYTFTVVNHSNPAFNADRLILTIKNDPTNFAVVPTGPIIPITPVLDSGDTMTFTTCIVPTTFPATIPDIVFGYRLQNSMTGDCCFESECDTILIPPCPTEQLCCDDFDEFCDLVDLGFQIITNEDCSISIDATQFDTCHWFGTPEPDWGDGSSGLQVITPAVGAGPWTHTYTQPGVYNVCITVYEGNNDDDFCWDKQICTEVIVECSGECCDDFEEFCDLVDQGFQIIVNEDCSVNIDATQFDECHWFGTPSPDWGDGSISFPLFTPAVGAGSWTHTYTQSGTYNICITVYEGVDEDNLCWDKQMCTEVVVACPNDDDCCDDFEEFCDLVDLGFSVINNEDCSITIDAIQFDTCHWFGTPIPDWGDGSISTQVITPAVGAGPWTHTYTQSGVYNICITVYEGNGVEDFCWDKQMCIEVDVDCGCEPDTSCFAVNNIESKEMTCDVDDCYAEPFCVPWLTTLMDNSTTNGCQLIVDYSVFHRATWNGQTVFVGYKSGAPNGGSQDIYSCDGELIQSCTQGGGGVGCNPDANIDIGTDLVSFNAFWNCGDLIPVEEDCGLSACMDYDDPYCSEWVVSLITDTNVQGCPTTSTFSFFKARINGQVVLIQEELGVPNIDRYTIYDCRGIVMQSCLISVGFETCTIDAGIDISTDIVDRVSLWTCGDSSPMQSTNCTSSNVCVDYCFDVTNTTNPSRPLDRIDINGAGGISPRMINLVPALMGGQTRAVSLTICGDYQAPDLINVDLVASDTCCTASLPISLEVPDCPIDSSGCCTDSLQFCNLVDLGFQIINNDDCSITIDATQFDSCHWYNTPAPDWGDGSAGFPILTPALGAGPWTYTYDNAGTYNICITVYEGDDEDSFCWDKEMCIEVTVECPCDPDDQCDDLSIYLDPTDDGECCFIGGLENDHCADLYKGIRIDVTAPASIAQVQALNGWTLSQLNPQSADLLPPGGTIPLGEEDEVFNICNTSDGSPITITFSWLQAGSNGECIAVCSETEELTCPVNQQGCVEIVQDSIDCENNLYCFRALNVTDPEIILKSLEFIWVSPSTASLTPNIISIAPLSMGDTTDWVCVQYDTMIDTTCFVLVGHEADLPAGEPVTWCCTDTTKYYILPEEECPCDLTGINCDALEVNMVPDPITGDTCCFVGSINNEYCADLFKGIKINTVAPASISSVQGLNGWIVNTLSSTEAEVYPPTPHIPLGPLDIFSGCNLDGSLNSFMVAVSWLVEDGNGDCVEYCDETFDLSCDGPDPDCIAVVADSLDCNIDEYCFKIQNNTSPAFTIQSIDLVSILPSGTILMPNPISIPPLSPGSTSDWICVDYTGITFGDTLCYKTVAHDSDITAGNFPTQCCISSDEHCFVFDEELCPPDPGDCCTDFETFCDLVDIGFQMSVDTGVLTVMTTQFDSCHWFTMSTPDFDDGIPTQVDTLSADGVVSWTHVYDDSGMYNICIEVIQMTLDSTVCYSKEMCKMLWYQVDEGSSANPCDPSQINIPNGFTPNGDGFNDVFVIDGNDACSPLDLMVFNRWGQVVFEQKEYDNSWDGRSSNGTELVNGTYYIVVDFSNVDNQRLNNSRYTGFLDIRRN